MEEQAIMNGYVPEMEDPTPPPQVERRLLVRVEKTVRFSHAPHSDVEEGSGNAVVVELLRQDGAEDQAGQSDER